MTAGDVHVFGHSKGSHAVALTAMNGIENHKYAKYFAFGQPGRTAVRMNNYSPPTALGTPGYIEKLSENLVGITWENDEVQYFKGGEFFPRSGLAVPETFGFPGIINDRSPNGTASLNSRIDHHKNYGGTFERDVQFYPYFWGNQDCIQSAFDVMNTGATPTDGQPGERRHIGSSEPRENCVYDRSTPPLIPVTAELSYLVDLKDPADCALEFARIWTAN